MHQSCKKEGHYCMKIEMCQYNINDETTLSEEMEELGSTQEEANTKLILHSRHITASSSDV